MTAARLWWVGAALSVADGATTWVGLRRAGGAFEGNPLMARAMSLVGVDATIALRVMVGVAAFFWAGRIASRDMSLGRVYAVFTVMFVGLLATAAVVWSNLLGLGVL